MKKKIIWYAGTAFFAFVMLVIVIDSIAGTDPRASEPIVTAGSSTISATDTTATTSIQPKLVDAERLSTTSISGVRIKKSGCAGDKTLPDSACTPGDILSVTAEQVCVSGYSASVRNVPDSEKKQVFQEYGISYDLHGNYEVDHLISLELGGSNDISNLWPESYSISDSARAKDKLENYLHAQVCNGSMTLAEAQREISSNWIMYFDQYGLTRAPSDVSQSQPVPQSAAQTQVAPAAWSFEYYRVA